MASLPPALDDAMTAILLAFAAAVFLGAGAGAHAVRPATRPSAARARRSASRPSRCASCWRRRSCCAARPSSGARCRSSPRSGWCFRRVLTLLTFDGNRVLGPVVTGVARQSLAAVRGALAVRPARRAAAARAVRRTGGDRRRRLVITVDAHPGHARLAAPGRCCCRSAPPCCAGVIPPVDQARARKSGRARSRRA